MYPLYYIVAELVLMPTIIREHRGGLAESMATARTVESRAELCQVIRESLAPFWEDVTPEMIKTRRYGYDRRLDWWDTFIISVEGYGVWGFSKGEVPA